MSSDIPEKLVRHFRSEYSHLGGKGHTAGQIRNTCIIIQTITKTALVRVDTIGYLGRHPESEQKDLGYLKRNQFRIDTHEDIERHPSSQPGVATHSSILAWKIPRTEEPGGLQSTGSQRLGHNLATEQQIISASTATTYLFFIVQMNQLYHLYAHYSIHL